MSSGVLLALSALMAIPTLALGAGLVWPGENERKAYVASLLAVWTLPLAILLIVRFAPDWRFFWLWVWIAFYLVIEYKFVLPLFGTRTDRARPGS